MNKEIIRTGLTYAGALPLILCMIAVHVGMPTIFEVSVNTVALAYSMAIIAFIAGSHWGLKVCHPRTSMPLYVISNAIVVAVWMAFLVLPVHYALLVNAAAFAYLWFIDNKLFEMHLIDREYFEVRKKATLIVIFALLLHIGGV